LSYITGSKEFWSLDFRVSPSVLIPRPDTEVLVEKVLELSKRSGETIIDVGTGSGNIAVALAKEMPKSTIYAVDISKRALRVARSNAARLGTGNIEFRLSNLFYAFREHRGYCSISSFPTRRTYPRKGLGGPASRHPGPGTQGGVDGGGVRS
jgi:Methylase of polypeptide chain release factors